MSSERVLHRLQLGGIACQELGCDAAFLQVVKMLRREETQRPFFLR